MIGLSLNMGDFARKTGLAEKQQVVAIKKSLNTAFAKSNKERARVTKQLSRFPAKLVKEELLVLDKAKNKSLRVRSIYKHRTFYPDKGEVSYRKRKKGVAVRSYKGKYIYYPTAFEADGKLYYRDEKTNRAKRLVGQPRLRQDTVLDSVQSAVIIREVFENLEKQYGYSA